MEDNIVVKLCIPCDFTRNHEATEETFVAVLLLETKKNSLCVFELNFTGITFFILHTLCENTDQ